MNKNKIKQKAGVVACRQTEAGKVEILVVSGRKYPNSWLFPVGTVERGETPAQAAVRECLEESGYRVELGPCLAEFDLPKNKSTQHFTFFLGRVTGEVEEYERDRQRRWVTQAELLKTVNGPFAPAAQATIETDLSGFMGFKGVEDQASLRGETGFSHRGPLALIIRRYLRWLRDLCVKAWSPVSEK